MRRRLWWAGTAMVVVMVMAFVMDGGPRWSGLLDAVGATHCEYVQVVAAEEQPSVWSSWEEFSASDSSDGEQDLSALETIAAEHGAELTMAASLPGSVTERTFTVQALGGHLVVAHHDESWTGTDRVHVVDPAHGGAHWAAELVHPVRNPDFADDPRRRVLLGLGIVNNTVVLQTPTHDETGTDVALAPLDEERLSNCARLGPPVQTTQVLPYIEAAWVQVIDLNQWWDGEDQMLILQGATGDAQTPQGPLDGTWVDVATADIGATETIDVSSGLPEGVTGVTADEHTRRDSVLGEYRLEPVGEGFHLLTWDNGYAVMAG